MERVPSSQPTAEAHPSSAASSFRVRDYLFLCLSRWPWFVVCLALSLACAWLYLRRTPSVYQRTISILIKTDQRGDGTENTLRELGVADITANVDNEILSLQTYDLALRVTQRLALDISYWHEGIFHNAIAYGVSLPVTVTLPDIGDRESASFHVTLLKDSIAELSDFRLSHTQSDTTISARLGEETHTPLGRLTVTPSPYYYGGQTDRLLITRAPVSDAARTVQSHISATLQGKKSTIIDVSYRDVSVARSEDVLNTLVAVYNENWVTDRNQITVSTNEFIRERLSVIEHELSDVDQDISSYKSANLMPDVQEVGSIAMSQATAAEQEETALANQVYMVRYIRGYLADGQHNDRLLPTSSGISSLSIGRQIDEYNEVLLTRNNHLANSSLQNPLVRDYDQQLESMRHTIIQSLDNELAILGERQRSLESTHTRAVTKIASNPGQAKYLLSVERQQKVKESLYLFLLQKREENELSQAFTAYNTRLIQAPHGSSAPSSPVPGNVYSLALAIGLLFPAACLFIKETLSTTIRGRKDLQGMRAPYIGDIPLVKLSRKRGQTPEPLVVANNRDPVNEAFRVARTNLEFVLGFEPGPRTVLLTSLDPGVGKTFVTANLSAALGVKGKNVLAIDLDLRRGSLSEYAASPSMGLTNYLSGQTDDYQSLIVPLGSVDLLPCGTLPPNPTELLFAPRFASLMKDARETYDYVIIDCAPIDIVADASIISRYADLTLFVLRAGHTETSSLPQLDALYSERKFGSMSVILNATSTASHYGRYGYGRYAYGRYGYGSVRKRS